MTKRRLALAFDEDVRVRIAIVLHHRSPVIAPRRIALSSAAPCIVRPRPNNPCG